MPSPHFNGLLIHGERLEQLERSLHRNQSGSAAEAEARLRETATRVEAAGLSLNLRRLALAKPCPEHDALPGAYCWGSTFSRVRGLCMHRYAPSSGAPVPVTNAVIERWTHKVEKPNRRGL